MRKGNPNSAPFPFVPVDPTSPENLEREKFYAEFKARLAKNNAEIDMRAKQQSYAENNTPYSNVNNKRHAFSKWDDPNYKSTQSQNNVFKDADSTPTEQLIWLIQNWIPEGEFTLLIGPPNSGKNTIALSIAAALSRGDSLSLWPGAILNRDGNSMLSSTEEKFASTSKKKFLANGGNKKSLININEISAPSATIANSRRRCKFSDEDYEIVGNEIKKNGNIALMILDPVTQVVRGNSGNKAKDREGYETLAQFAEDLKFAALGIGHPPKTTKGKGIYARIDGPAEAGKVSRSIIMVDKIKGGPLADGAEYVMVLAKSFGAPVNYGITYSIATCLDTDNGINYEIGKIVWHDIIPGTPEEILEWAENGEMAGAGKVSPLDAAIRFLSELVRNGPVLVGEVKKQAKVAGITTRDLQEAKKALGVVHFKGEKEGQDSPWYWCYPSDKPSKA